MLDTTIYKIDALAQSYDGETVLEIDRLTVKPASIVGLIGPNGSGKSTFLKILGLIEKPTKGSVYFDGRNVEPFSDETRFLITMLPQEPFLMKRSVFNNVSYGLKMRGNGKNITDQVYEALSLVGLPGGDFARRPWYALSGGEAQRVALAARLALKPKVLILDEPTASVDAASAQLIKEASLRARHELGTTLIVASHDWQWLYEICDEIVHLFKGKVFGSGRETVIFGPWEQLEPGKWGKRLSDKQLLRIPAPPVAEAAAVIDNISINGNGQGAGANEIVLRGIVSRLSLERNSGQLFATVLVGGFPFLVNITTEQSRTLNVFPGEIINISYRIDKIKWI
jgi:tungstate transport system ATP-binding protein